MKRCIACSLLFPDFDLYCHCGRRLARITVTRARLNQAVRGLRAVLRDALQRPDAPVLDLEWLILRCDDTLGYEGNTMIASLNQLKGDMRHFSDEFPGFLVGAKDWEAL